MARTRKQARTPDPRPQRTREHVIADLSVNYVERFIFEAGHSAVRVLADYGYDLIVQTFDEHGYTEEGFLHLQLKATDTIARYQRKGTFAFPVELKHYHLWRREPMPVYFVLYDAPRRRAYWIHTQAYFASKPPVKSQAQSFVLRVPRKNVFRKSTMEKMRRCKAETIAEIQGGGAS